MPPLDDFRMAMDYATAQVAATVPPDRARALLALLRADEIAQSPVNADELAPAVRPGWNLALRFCLERPDAADADGAIAPAWLAAWAERFLADCDQLALANLALARCAARHLHLQQRAPGAFVAWATSQRLSPEQRERADFDWWSAQVARQAAPRLAAIESERTHMRPLLHERDHMRALLSQGNTPIDVAGNVVGDPAVDPYYRQLGQAHVARFANQHSYPDDAAVGGATFRQYGDILALLIGWLYRERDRRASDDAHTSTSWDEHALIAALAAALHADPAAIGQALQPFILDRANAAYHSALPGAAPPLIRLDADRVALSARGLLGEPLLFLTRELRRRHAAEYHASAHLREGVFRQDLYRLFGDRRFVRSAGRVELKRSGQARTDLDALVFDRKTGTLGIFELKAQDPFARSVEERQRQRDNFWQADRQVAAILEWVRRYGPDDLLTRVDAVAARRVHVKKVHAFVLGRYLAHVADGAAPDRRAAWGSWPRVLQIAGDGPNGPLAPDQRNPLGALFTRLRATPPFIAPDDEAIQEIAVGDLRLRIFPSFAAMRAEEDRPA